MTIAKRPYYELHITFILPEGQAEPELEWWKYSKIDGDPVLDAGVKSYFTQQIKRGIRLESVIQILELAAKKVKAMGFPVLRTKVELVQYDNRR